MERQQRRLAAILAADVVGYSRLMGRDEAGTVTRLRRVREQHLVPILARRGGRIVKLMGDGAILEFASAVEAASAAIEFQQAMVEANRDQSEDTAIVFRIGLHLGDLIVEGDDLYGDGVNVAARLEAEAPPGGIVVSRAIREAVEGRLETKLHALGELTLKNIERPIRAFRVEWDAADWKVAQAKADQSGSPVDPAAPILALPDKPSIAVLPFQNMSGDTEQEYFADGVVEEIITALSRSKQLFVIARNSSFAYKGKSPDIRQVGRELGVRYVLEGSVRKSANRVRITGQLIDAISGAHIWADRFDDELVNVFDLQDRITEQVIGSLHPSIRSAEVERARRKRPESLDAYDLVMRALPDVWSLEREAGARAEATLLRALEIDPKYPTALALAAWCRAQRAVYNWSDNPSADHDLAVARARQAAQLAGDDPFVLAVLGASLATVKELDKAATCLQHALALDPNAAWAWNRSGWVHAYMAQPEVAIEHFERALRLSPFDQMVFNCHYGMGSAHLVARRYDESIRWYEKALRASPFATWMYRGLVPSYALAGRVQEATEGVVRLRASYPGLTIAAIRQALPFVQEAMEVYVEGLRLAGMPE